MQFNSLDIGVSLEQYESRLSVVYSWVPFDRRNVCATQLTELEYSFSLTFRLYFPHISSLFPSYRAFDMERNLPCPNRRPRRL